MSISQLDICNIALSKLGSKRITDFNNDESIEALLCREQYTQTLEALLRSHTWNFARKRVILSVNAVVPAFEWGYSYELPTDFLRVISIFEAHSTYALEGPYLLSNDDSVCLDYVANITNTSKFDSLFVQVFIDTMAFNLVMPLTQDRLLRRDLQESLNVVMARVRTTDKQENNNQGSPEPVTTLVNSRQVKTF